MPKNQDETALNSIFLSHEQARWVLMHFNSQSGETEAALEQLLQSLRRLGVPFAFDEIAYGTGELNRYLYEHLMELVLVLTLRSQGFGAQDLARIIVNYRDQFRNIFRRAYLERHSRLGAPRRLYSSRPLAEAEAGSALENYGTIELTTIRGTYLDLRIAPSPKGNPDLLALEIFGPDDAVTMMMSFQRNIYPRSPLPISNMAEDLVRVASGRIPAFQFNK